MTASRKDALDDHKELSVKTSEPMERASSTETVSSPDIVRDRLVDIVGKHGFWWWKILRYARAFDSLVPSPVDWIVRSTLGRLSLRFNDFRGSAWTTLSILIATLMLQFLGKSPERDSQLAIELAKVLLTASFLIGTILSFSVALPGQALMKLVLRDDPEYAVEFVAPFMWAFMWGILGAASLLTYHSRFALLFLRPYAIFVASYAACMLLHAITHAIRNYLLGLLMKSAQKDDGKNP